MLQMILSWLLVKAPTFTEAIKSWISRNVEEAAHTKGIFWVLVIMGGILILLSFTKRR